MHYLLLLVLIMPVYYFFKFILSYLMDNVVVQTKSAKKSSPSKTESPTTYVNHRRKAQ